MGSIADRCVHHTIECWRRKEDDGSAEWKGAKAKEHVAVAPGRSCPHRELPPPHQQPPTHKPSANY